MRSTIVHGNAATSPSSRRSTSPLRGTLSQLITVSGSVRPAMPRASRSSMPPRSYAPSVIVSVTRSAVGMRSTTASGSSAATSASRMTSISRASSRSGPREITV